MYFQQWSDGSVPKRSMRKNSPETYVKKTENVPDNNSLPTIESKQCHTLQNNETGIDWTSSYNTSMPENPTYFSHVQTTIGTSLQNNPTNDTIFPSCNEKREHSQMKMAEREMVSQIGQNPFFSNNTAQSYADHVGIQDKFLKPMSSIYIDKQNPKQ